MLQIYLLFAERVTHLFREDFRPDTFPCQNEKIGDSQFFFHRGKYPFAS